MPPPQAAPAMAWETQRETIAGDITASQSWEKACSGIDALVTKAFEDPERQSEFKQRVLDACILARYWCGNDPGEGVVDWWEWHRDEDREFAKAVTEGRTRDPQAEDLAAQEACRTELTSEIARISDLREGLAGDESCRENVKALDNKIAGLQKKRNAAAAEIQRHRTGAWQRDNGGRHGARIPVAEAVRELSWFMERFGARATWPARRAAHAWGIQIADAPKSRGMGLGMGSLRIEGPMVPFDNGAVLLDEKSGPWPEYAMARAAGGSGRPFHLVFGKFLEELARELELGSPFAKEGVGAYERCGNLLLKRGQWLIGAGRHPEPLTFLAFELAVLFRMATSGSAPPDGKWPGTPEAAPATMPNDGRPRYDLIALLAQAVFPNTKTQAAAGRKPRAPDATSLRPRIANFLSEKGGHPEAQLICWPDPAAHPAPPRKKGSSR